MPNYRESKREELRGGMEPGPVQQHPVTGQEAMDTNWNTRGSSEHQKHFCVVWVTEHYTGCRERLWSLLLRDLQKPPGRGILPWVSPLDQGQGQKDPEVPDNCSCAVVLWDFGTWDWGFSELEVKPFSLYATVFKGPIFVFMFSVFPAWTWVPLSEGSFIWNKNLWLTVLPFHIVGLLVLIIAYVIAPRLYFLFPTVYAPLKLTPAHFLSFVESSRWN